VKRVAAAVLAGLADLRTSEDPQDKALINVTEGFTAAPGSSRRPRCATPGLLSPASAPCGSATTACAGHGRWQPAPPRELCDTATTGELLSLLGSWQPGHLPPILQAERDLTVARLAADDHDPSAAAAFATAVTSLRELSTLYIWPTARSTRPRTFSACPTPTPSPSP
jgi:hypothetical protein